MVVILMISRKQVSLGLLKMTSKFQVNKVANKILSRDSDCLVVLVIGTKFGNSSNSMKDVIIASIYKNLTAKIFFFLGGWGVGGGR